MSHDERRGPPLAEVRMDIDPLLILQTSDEVESTHCRVGQAVTRGDSVVCVCMCVCVCVCVKLSMNNA